MRTIALGVTGSIPCFPHSYQLKFKEREPVQSYCRLIKDSRLESTIAHLQALKHADPVESYGSCNFGIPGPLGHSSCPCIVGSIRSQDSSWRPDQKATDQSSCSIECQAHPSRFKAPWVGRLCVAYGRWAEGPRQVFRPSGCCRSSGC